MGEWFHLWQLWWSGQQLHDELLWGYTVWSWARIGKVLQLAGVATVVLELVGPTRVSRARAAVESAAEALFGPVGGTAWDYAYRRKKTMWAGAALLVAVGAGLLLSWALPFWQGALLGIAVWSVLAGLHVAFTRDDRPSRMLDVIGMLVGIPAVVSQGVLLVAVYPVTLAFLALFWYALTYRRIRIALNSWSVFAILVGFSFDLLAS